jgi:hypothetical protein
MIRLTYSKHAAARTADQSERDTSYLPYLENQREELMHAIFQAPRHRLDHLATFVETHGERLSHFLEALVNYRRGLRTFRLKRVLVGFFISILCGGAAALAIMITNLLPGMDQRMLIGVGGAVTLVILFLWMTLLLKYFVSGFHRSRLDDLDTLTPIENQTRRDTWEAVRGLVSAYLKKTAGRFSLRQTRREYASVRQVYEKGSRDIREALNELSTITDDESAEVDVDASTSAEAPLEREKEGRVLKMGRQTHR